MVRRLLQKIERFLWARGFILAPVREILAAQLLLCGLFLVPALGLAPFTAWPLYFCLGACLVTGAFWSLAKTAQDLPAKTFSLKLAAKLFAGFSLRLLAVGAVLYVVVVVLRAPPLPLLAGLSVTMITITVWGLLRMALHGR